MSSQRSTTPRKGIDKGAKKGAKGSKKGQVTTTTSCNDDDKEADGSSKEYVAAIKYDFKRQTWQLSEHFEKLLEAACPNHVNA
jgi:hypothetical protein